MVYSFNRFNYLLMYHQEAFRIFQWDIQAFERSHPLACPACEPKIKRIIKERDSKMREKIWAEATASKADPLDAVRNGESDGDPGALDGRARRWMRTLGMDAELWVWRAGWLGWTAGTLLYASVAFTATATGKYAWGGILAHWLTRRWIPWWKALRFRVDRVEGEDEWQACERIISTLRLVVLVGYTLGLGTALSIGLGTEMVVSPYAGRIVTVVHLTRAIRSRFDSTRSAVYAGSGRDR
jgi:hypothetical protein